MSTPSASPDPTEALIARAKAGARDAYDELFADACERLHLYLRLRVGDALRQKEESLDLLQETYLAAHRAFADFEPRGRGAFLSWLCRIAENCIRARVDFHTAAQRMPPEDLERVSQVFDRIRNHSLGPATRAERQDCRQRLAEAMMSLPREEREALLMRHFQGENVSAIADHLGTSATSVRRLLARATVLLGTDLAAAEGRPAEGPT